MNLNLDITNEQLLLPKSQQLILKGLEGHLKELFTNKLLASEEGVHIKVAILALDIIQACQEESYLFIKKRELFFSTVFCEINKTTKTILKKVLKITRRGFFPQLLNNPFFLKKTDRTQDELKNIVKVFHEEKALKSTLSNVNKNEKSKIELFSQQTYDKLINCSNYLNFPKLINEFLALPGNDREWKQGVYEHLLNLLNSKHYSSFDDFEKKELFKIIFSLHSPYNKTTEKKCTKSDMNEYLHLCFQLKHQGGDEILAFCITSLRESHDIHYEDILRGFNLIILQFNSVDFFANIHRWTKEKLHWSTLLNDLEINLVKTGLDDSYFQEDIFYRLEKFKNDPTVTQALSDEELKLIHDQYKIIDEFCKKYCHLKFNELINIAHEIREFSKVGLIDPVKRLQLIAIARLAIRIEFGIYPYSTQIFALLGLLINTNNRQAQIKTGEGKSIIVALFAFVMSMECRAVDIITSARYLSIRDHDKFNFFFQRSGIASSHICYDQKKPEHFRSQVLYAPAFDFEFAWMEDLLWGKKLYQERLKNPFVSRNFDIVCIDESDNLLIDGAKNGARLSYPAEVSYDWVYAPILSFVREEGKLITQQPEKALVELDVHLKQIVEMQKENGYQQLPIKKLRTLMKSAYKAQFLLSENKEYVLNESKDESNNKVKSIQIVDLQTGRISQNSRWSDGLHEFLEVKHDITLEKESVSPITISHAVFYQFYKTISALTGTAEKFQTKKIYQMDTFHVPPHLPLQRKDLPPIIVKNQEDATLLIIQKTKQIIHVKRPILILCYSIDETKKLADRMKSENIHFQLLNEVQEEQEHIILSQAGNPGKVTIATNNAGRGTDIILSEESLNNGGLHILLTFYPDSERCEHQAIGRAGRQGQVGSSQMILNRENLLATNLINEEESGLSELEIITSINFKRKIREIFQGDLQVRHAELDRFLATKTHAFFKCFQKWVYEIDKDEALDNFAQKLANFNILPNKILNFETLCKDNSVVATSFNRLLTKKSNALAWKIFLQETNERLKNMIINSWVNVFFKPAEKKLLALNLNSKKNLEKDFIDEDHIFKNDLEATKLIIDSKFEDFCNKWQKYLAEDCSGLFIYLNEITTIDLLPVLNLK